METPFSVLIRTATQDQHTETENSSFMRDMLGGKLGVEAFARYTEQLWFVYQALESATESLADDPVSGPFVMPELLRLPSIERDLARMRGAGWQDSLSGLPATLEYADRITEVAAAWPAGYVAHHYTRYLGDLSGGQIIRGTAEKTWGFAHKGDGVRFYVFADIANPAAFKRRYRALLDAVPADGPERTRMAEECNRAFTLNGRVFAELGMEFDVVG